MDERPHPEPGAAPSQKAVRDTQLAGERTFLAWWRSGVAAVIAAIAVGKLLPVLTDRGETLSVILGVGFAVIGAAAIGYGWLRHRNIERALSAGTFDAADTRATLAFSVFGVILAVLALVIVVVST